MSQQIDRALIRQLEQNISYLLMGEMENTEVTALMHEGGGWELQLEVFFRGGQAFRSLKNTDKVKSLKDFDSPVMLSIVKELKGRLPWNPYRPIDLAWWA